MCTAPMADEPCQPLAPPWPALQLEAELLGLKHLLLSGTPLGAAACSPAACTPASDYFSGASLAGPLGVGRAAKGGASLCSAVCQPYLGSQASRCVFSRLTPMLGSPSGLPAVAGTPGPALSSQRLLASAPRLPAAAAAPAAAANGEPAGSACLERQFSAAAEAAESSHDAGSAGCFGADRTNRGAPSAAAAAVPLKGRPPAAGRPRSGKLVA